MANDRQIKLEKLTENLVITAKQKEPKTELLYIRVNKNHMSDLTAMQKHFGFDKRTDLVRTIIEDAIKNFHKILESEK